MTKERGQRRACALGRRIGRDIVRGGVLLAVLHLFVVQISIVRGQSMEPSLVEGDRLVVDRLTYQLGEVNRFDVVILRYPNDPSVDFVKRIVGLPGDRVQLVGGRVFLNGVGVEEDFLHVPDHDDTRETLVPPGCYYVLGDNRPISCDSREFGLVPFEYLKGKVRVRFWPPARLSLFR